MPLEILQGPDGSDCIAYDRSSQSLFLGGREGEVSVFDLRREGVVHTMSAHNLSVKMISIDVERQVFATGSTDGDLKLWDLYGWDLKQEWADVHHKTTFMSQGGKTFGITQVACGPSGTLYSCGSDGTIKAFWPQSQ